MDFDRAAARLQKDQAKLLKGRLSRKSATTRPTSSTVETPAARQRRLHQERLAKERQLKKEREEFFSTLKDRFEASPVAQGSLRIPSSTTSHLFPTTTSIHGQGDKIALPPRALEYLTQTQGMEASSSSPWTFRIAIPNPEYSFPASPLVQQLFSSTAKMNPTEDEIMSDDDTDEEEETEGRLLDAFVDELRYKYLSYTHGTVVEFTQEEGHVGLPQSVAKTLIQNSATEIPVHRTRDPAAVETDDDDIMVTEDDDNEEMTPGHLAWGAFDVPSLPIEVSLVQLPKGKSCTLTPTIEAIRNGFYNLKDIKLVLEQSLIRTRATLSVNDTVHTWHRGKKYDLTVSHVEPSTQNAILCINTDIEVEFGTVDRKLLEEEKILRQEEDHVGSEESRLVGRTLGSMKEQKQVLELPIQSTASIDLKPEPPLDQSTNVCEVQVRADGSRGKRRFDVKESTVGDLFVFAGTLVSSGSFQLVTRFPRRVLTMNESTSTLESAGIHPGQELFLVERL